MPKLDIEPPQDAEFLKKELHWIKQTRQKYDKGMPREDRYKYLWWTNYLLERQDLLIAVLAIDVVKSGGTTMETGDNV